MSKTVCVVYHSGYGHTLKQAAAIADGVSSVAGVECHFIAVEALHDAEAGEWDALDAAAAIVMGSPTYMGAASADFKKFMELSSARWMEQRWADKLAAGFTNSGSQNGDKQNTLVELLTFAAQHGMLWISLNQLPGNNHSAGSVEDLNRLGASLGAMAQSNVDQGSDVAPIKSDLETARAYGARVARCALQWSPEAA